MCFEVNQFVHIGAVKSFVNGKVVSPRKDEDRPHHGMRCLTVYSVLSGNPSSQIIEKTSKKVYYVIVFIFYSIFHGPYDQITDD